MESRSNKQLRTEEKGKIGPRTKDILPQRTQSTQRKPGKESHQFSVVRSFVASGLAPDVRDKNAQTICNKLKGTSHRKHDATQTKPSPSL